MNQQEYDKRAKEMAEEFARRQMEGMRNIGMASPGNDLAAYMTKEQKKRRRAKLDESRPLKGSFMDYLAEEKPWWSYIDQDQEYQEQFKD